MGHTANGQEVQLSFHPYQALSLAEVATIISRLLRGDIYAGSEEYWYHSHILALQKAGSIPIELNPLKIESREEVYTILRKVQ
jgi:hypothetical protein